MTGDGETNNQFLYQHIITCCIALGDHAPRAQSVRQINKAHAPPSHTLIVYVLFTS